MSNDARRPTASLTTLGCKLNIADSEAIARRLRDGGWLVQEGAADADAIIVNSCSVTQTADKKSRALVRRARRTAPQARVVLTGCMVKTAPQHLLDGLGADMIKAPEEQTHLTEELLQDLPDLQMEAAGQPSLRTRGFVAAQTGCNDVCAFCIIPRTRGRERSKPIAAVVAEVRQLEEEGCREVVITGTQLGAFGRDSGEGTPSDLLAALLRETGIPRIRMSSLQPQDISAHVLELWQDTRLCRHFHLALQSGSDAVLRRMRRRYTASEYLRAAERIKAAIAGVSITTDMIVGFPGEDRPEFEESLAFAGQIGFSAVHVFPYSERSGTSAAKMDDHVPPEEKAERVKRLSAVADAMATAFRSAHLGAIEPVLWESRDAAGAWQGLTDSYLRVRTHSDIELSGRITQTRLAALDGGEVIGEL